MSQTAPTAVSAQPAMDAAQNQRQPRAEVRPLANVKHSFSPPLTTARPQRTAPYTGPTRRPCRPPTSLLVLVDHVPAALPVGVLASEGEAGAQRRRGAQTGGRPGAQRTGARHGHLADGGVVRRRRRRYLRAPQHAGQTRPDTGRRPDIVVREDTQFEQKLDIVKMRSTSGRCDEGSTCHLCG